MAAPFFRTLFALIAVALPVLLAFNLSPSVTFFNQAMALLGWGLFALALALQPSVFQSRGRVPGLWALWAALLLMALAALGSWHWVGLPTGLTLSSLGMLGACALVVSVAAHAQRMGRGQSAYQAFCGALLVAGVLSLVVALVQYFAPEWADGSLIARNSGVGRVGGNLRQPNHLSSLLLWSVVALVWLHDTHVEDSPKQERNVVRSITALLLMGLLLGVVLTVSRTGGICVLMLAGWAAFDRSMSIYLRRLLWAAPLFYFACWFGVSEWAQAGAHAFSGADQLHKADLSSSRFGIWSNTLWLLNHHLWLGVGWGEFNLAWTLTPFPGRPTAFFDHTHNLPLHLLVEMGLPLGLSALGLLAWGQLRGVLACLEARASERPLVRSAFMMVLMMAVHSLLEYPLWYAYFLLPTAFAFGLCLAGGARPGNSNGNTRPPTYLLWGAAALALGALVAVADYMSVVAVFSPPANAAPLTDRIASGQRSLFFAHHADYAAATTTKKPSEATLAFERSTHFLLDTRLMMAWAQALNEQGEVAKAQYLAQRLAEFHNPNSVEFFAACKSPAMAEINLPFQCHAPTKEFTFEDFRGSGSTAR
jgi:O-antigen ligase